MIKIDNRNLQEHRVIWALVHGAWPEKVIDHRDGDATNNRFSNLRECEQWQNSVNAKMRRDNTSGFKGVSYHKRTRRYTAAIQQKGKLHYLGLFSTAEEASAAYQKAATELHGDFARPH
ncbi:HNH endonuclease (plasmid) [Skermanella rosea]|uniref:HNH endonuclease n=1 Tax=Skermanella rosea TaxID=1817965 RepID=UPI001934AEEB|nr:HNH endonuclease [Skermanella rosea]UEM08132.1 HNH endonuclease [Skermanella rosea]